MKPNAMILFMTGLSLAVMLAIPSQLKNRNTKAVGVWSKVVVAGSPPNPPLRKGGLPEAPLFKGGLGGSDDWEGAQERSTGFDHTKAVAANPAENNIWQKGSFPVENFQAYSSSFGYREYPYQGFHYGLDLAAPQGSYIRSWWSGKVVEVWSDSKCGTGIMIQSGNWKHIYCHLKGDVLSTDGRPYLLDRDGGIQLWQGQQVLTGQRIGRVGMSGRTNGPHLHWGLKHANQWVDPALVLKAMYNSGGQNPHWQRSHR